MTPELQPYVFLGVGVAISVLGFFLKKEARKTSACEQRLTDLEVLVAKNEVLDGERWRVAEKLLEDRRSDVKNLFKKLNEK